MNFERMAESAAPEVATFITRLQAKPESHIAYLGEDYEGNLAGIAGFQPPFNVLVAREAGKLIGALGVDIELETRRAWLHGPFVDHLDWGAVADGLHKAAKEQGVIPAFVVGEELLGVRQNARLAAFAARHGFTPVRPANSLRFSRERLTSLPNVEVPDLNQRHHAAFVALHDATFPNTYYSGTQLVAMIDQRHRALVAEMEGQLAGYIFAQVRPDDGDGYIDFLGVAEPFRRRGLGKRLIIAATRWLLSDPIVKEVLLTVFDDDRPAMALYARLGFEHRQSLTGYRKNWNSKEAVS